MNIGRSPRVSFVLASHNRCEVLAHTLSRIARCGLDRDDYEIIVVDNASTDGTPDEAAEHADLLLRRRRNAGSCAKAFGVDRATGRYVVFLDDDSFPRPGALHRMIPRFEDDPKLGAAGFTVHLPDGRREGSALPGVFVGCGVGFRAEALRSVGNLDHTFFMQAEEYDLSFRLVAAGWRVEVFDDLHVEHLKAAEGRCSDRTAYYDVRNNLRVVARYLPSPYYEVYRNDWPQRYAWLAARDGRLRYFVRGLEAGRCGELTERRKYRRHRLSAGALEHFFGWGHVRRHMAAMSASGVRRVILADLGKNVFAFHRAARQTGVTVSAIGDDRFSAPGRQYRGVPVVPLDEALALEVDAVVVGNASAVHAAQTRAHVSSRTGMPVHDWFGVREHSGLDRNRLSDPFEVSDEHSVVPITVD